MKRLIILASLLALMAAAMPTLGQTKSALVKTMGQRTLQPLPETPREMRLPWADKTYKFRQICSFLDAKSGIGALNGVKRVAPDYKMPAQIYGLLVYSNKWPQGNGKGNYGVYTFTADNPASMTAVMKDDAMAANGGAIYAKGRLNVLNYEDLWGMIILSYDYYQYSTQYWDLLQQVHQDDVTRLMSAAGAYDPTTESYYAVMYTDDMQHQVFGTLDYASNSRQVIRQIPDADQLCALAVSLDGTLYAIRFNGQLVTVDKSTGLQAVVGPTGIAPKYLQSAAIDPRTGRMFWAACSEENPVGLYEVNLETGEALLIQQFKNSEELVGLYIPMPDVEEDAPAQMMTLTTTFTNDELTGTVNFRLPKKTYAGEDITDAELGYRVYVDSALVAEGTGTPGDLIHQELTLPGNKMYRFEASAVNSVGEGPRIHLDKFVGKDQPQAPTGVKLTRKAGSNELKLTWNAPSSVGVHKGYVDKTQLNYTVRRMPDDVVVAEKTTERTVSEFIDTEALVNYYYVVTPFNGDIEGVSAQSNRITMGSVVEPPYMEDFEDLTVIPNMYTFVDANNDGATWKSGFWNGTQNSDIYYQYNEDGKTAADDWAFTPPVHLKANRFYAISFDVNCYFIGTEKMSAWMGDDKTVNAMSQQLVPTTVVDDITPRTLTRVFKNDADCQRFFGFHAESDADQGLLELDNIRIEERGVFEAPDTVTNFVVTPGKNGGLSAEVSFTAPVQDFYGNPITEIEKIEVWRNGELIQLFDHPEPGSMQSFKEQKLSQGNSTWTVYTYNSYGCGIPAERTAWIGEDIPTEPENLTLKMSGNTARLTWKAPKTGVHGGYVNSTRLTYNIEDMNFFIKGDHRSGTTYTENRGSTQEFLSYRVSAQSSAGGGNYAESNTVISGTPYKLPFSESFANAATDHLWSQQNTGGQIGLTKNLAADGDQGCAIFIPERNGDIGMFTSGKINVSTAQYPILEFYYYAIPGATMSLTVAAVPEGVADDLQALTTIDYAKLKGSEGWRKAKVSLESYVGTGHILLAFIGRATGNSLASVAIDAIVVREQDDVDLAVERISVPSLVEAGTKTQVKADVYNNGRLAVGDYQVKLTRNGVLLAQQNGKDLAAGTTKTYSFDLQTKVVDEESTDVEVSVTASGDADPQNDAQTAKLTLNMPLFPAPTAAEGAEVDNELEISWMAPDLSPRNIMTTDDFERYQPFIIDGIGQWKTRDADGEITLAMQTGDDNYVLYDHVGEPMAWQVFNTSLAGLESVPALQPHSGGQMLINMLEAYHVKADDWLISRELPGTEQTVSFWVKSMTETTIETFQLLTSQTDDKPASFTEVEASASQAPSEWTLVTATLPEGTKYFAIRVNDEQKFMLMIDDIEYSPLHTAGLKLLGYNVYLDDERVNDELITETSCQVFWMGGVNYRVTAVYEQGESAPSQPITLASGIAPHHSPLTTHPSSFYDLQGRKIENRKSLRGVYIENGRKVVK